MTHKEIFHAIDDIRLANIKALEKELEENKDEYPFVTFKALDNYTFEISIAGQRYLVVFTINLRMQLGKYEVYQLSIDLNSYGNIKMTPVPFFNMNIPYVYNERDGKTYFDISKKVARKNNSDEIVSDLPKSKFGKIFLQFLITYETVEEIKN